MSDPAWAAFTDEQLLEVRMCDLGVTIEGTDLEARIAQLNTEINRILQLPDVRARLLELGAEPASTSPEQFLDFIRHDNEKWAKLIRERGIVIEK